jgi:hypothetical protein
MKIEIITALNVKRMVFLSVTPLFWKTVSNVPEKPAAFFLMTEEW